MIIIGVRARSRLWRGRVGWRVSGWGGRRARWGVRRGFCEGERLEWRGTVGGGGAVDIEKQVIIHFEDWENDTEASILANPFQYP